jgi:SAM-dependent methyltransferase
VFDKVMPPYFEPEFKFGTDVQICRKALEKGFEVWADTSIEFGHLRDERVTITSRNRQGFMFSDTIAGETKQQFVASGIYQSLIEDAQEFTGYEDVIEMNRVSAEFLTHRHETLLTDAEWYRLYPKERVARQVMFNTANAYKRQMTEFILASIGPPPLDVLDFGCGIGLIGFTLAQHGYRVTALDIGGSGPLEFLKWRAKKHGVQMTFHESLGGVPGLCGTHYNAIVAMDSLEHLKDWRRALRELADHLKPQGGLFSNNAILVDDLHPEHYPLGNREFVAACVSLGLMPVNQITYVKKPEAAPVHGGLVADPAQELVDA